MNRFLRSALIGVGVLAFAVTGTGCSVSTQPDTVALAYNDGPFSPRTFDKCIPNSKREVQGPSDVAFVYPDNQRNNRFDGKKDADNDPIPVADKDGFVIGFPGDFSFILNTDCDVLKEFHDKIGNNKQAYFDDGNESAGWKAHVIDNLIDNPLRKVLAAEASKYTWRQMNSDKKVRDDIEKAVNASIGAAINAKTEGPTLFFREDSFNLSLNLPLLPGELTKAITEEQTKVATARTAEAEARARIATAKAETTEEEQKAAKQRAIISGYPSVRAYLEAQAIEKGINPYQPSYGGSVVTAPAEPAK